MIGILIEKCEENDELSGDRNLKKKHVKSKVRKRTFQSPLVKEEGESQVNAKRRFGFPQ